VGAARSRGGWGALLPPGAAGVAGRAHTGGDAGSCAHARRCHAGARAGGPGLAAPFVAVPPA